MANFFEKRDRHVIPNWRSFENTSKLGELNCSVNSKLDSSFKPDISGLLEEWKDSKNIGIAGDLLGIGIICNQEDNPILLEISEYIINHNRASQALLDTAKSLKRKNGNQEFKLELDNTDLFLPNESFSVLFDQIHALKVRIIRNPRNPIAWVELARLYSINGQHKHAEKAMRNALYLAPENRFVLRNMVRFFTHIGDIDFAHDHIRKTLLVQHDPWVMATEISIADMRGRGSRFAKKGLQLVESKSLHPFNISELASAIATLELSHANIKKSNALFQQSLIHPNDNSLAQAEWASQEEDRLRSVDPSRFRLSSSFEALALDAAEHNQWKEAIDFSKQWFLDMPFSKRSIMFGSEVAARRLNDQKQAAEIAMLGLRSHPTDVQLLNNIAYSLCLENNTDEAKIYLNRIKLSELDELNISNICVTATRGLFNFRSGKSNEGRILYYKAIELANTLNNSHLAALAFVNYAREELRVKEDDMTLLMTRLEEIKNIFANNDLGKFADEVIQMSKE